ncbi:MAG: hypothetical protein ACE5GN_04945, partial [Waddliaceae bacterium]
MLRNISLVFLLLFSYSSVCFGSQALNIIEEIPVQEGGRVKPFLSFANEVTLFITGKHRFQGQSPAATVIEWIAMPEESAKKPIIPVTYKPLQEEFGEAVINGRISPEVVLQNRLFLQKVEVAAVKKRNKDSLTALEEKRLEAHERAMLFSAIAQGLTPGVIAKPDDPLESWMPFHYLGSEEGVHVLSQYYPVVNVQQVRGAFQALLEEGSIRGVEAVDLATAELFSVSLKNLAASRD